MAVLKSLTFTTMPTPDGNPMLDRRARVIARLEEQKLILKDPNYIRTDGKMARGSWSKSISGWRPGGDNTQTALMRCSFEAD
jgi:hypothetical protein